MQYSTIRVFSKNSTPLHSACCLRCGFQARQWSPSVPTIMGSSIETVTVATMIVEYYQEFVMGPKGVKPGRSSTRQINKPEGAVFKFRLDVPDFLFEPLIIDMKIEADYENMMRDVIQQVMTEVSLGPV